MKKPLPSNVSQSHRSAYVWDQHRFSLQSASKADELAYSLSFCIVKRYIWQRNQICGVELNNLVTAMYAQHFSETCLLEMVCTYLILVFEDKRTMLKLRSRHQVVDLGALHGGRSKKIIEI